jgi:hypothetical protein
MTFFCNASLVVLPLYRSLRLTYKYTEIERDFEPLQPQQPHHTRRSTTYPKLVVHILAPSLSLLATAPTTAKKHIKDVHGITTATATAFLHALFSHAIILGALLLVRKDAVGV